MHACAQWRGFAGVASSGCAFCMIVRPWCDPLRTLNSGARTFAQESVPRYDGPGALGDSCVISQV